MEHLWSQAGATSGNRGQIRQAQGRRKDAEPQPLATRGNVPSFDGKEGVDGSSPSEGSAKPPARRRFPAATKPEQPSGDREFAGGVGELVHEGGFHFVDRRGRELVRGGDFAPLACGLRDLGEHATSVVRL